MLLLPDQRIQYSLREKAKQVAAPLTPLLNKKEYTAALKMLAPHICRTPWVLEHIVVHGVAIDGSFSYDTQSVVEQCRATFERENPFSQSYPFATEHFIASAVHHELDCLVHILKSVCQEYPLRFKQKTFTPEGVSDILYEVFSLNQKFKELKSLFPARYSLHELTRRERMRNSDELFLIATEVKKLLRSEMDTLSLVEKLYSFQTRYWQMITSTDMIIIPDYNYRRHVNGTDNQPHSLHPFPDFDDDIMMSSLGEYTAFIEASTSTTVKGYNSSFGFVHMNHIDKDGNPFQVEFPVIMVDERILAVQHPMLKDVISYDLEVKSHHDLLHHLIPVYADHFILHHPDAPIEFGGKLDDYVNFGKKSRLFKEEYELTLGVALRQLKEHQEMLQPGYIEEQIEKLLHNLKRISRVSDDVLKDTVGSQQVSHIITFLATIYLSRCLTIYDIRKHDFDSVKAFVRRMPIDQLTVKLSDILDRLHMIGVTLQHIQSPEEFIGILKNGITTSDPEVLLIVDYLREIFVPAEIKGSAFKLGNWESTLWRILCMPQRKQHFAYTARVTAKNYMYFGAEELITPFELIARQFNILQKDIKEYEQRFYLRQRTSELLMSIFNTIYIAHRSGIYINSMLQRSIPDKDQLSKVVRFFDSLYKELYYSTYTPVDNIKLSEILTILSTYQDIYGDLSRFIFEYIFLAQFTNKLYKDHINHKKILATQVMELG